MSEMSTMDITNTTAAQFSQDDPATTAESRQPAPSHQDTTPAAQEHQADSSASSTQAQDFPVPPAIANPAAFCWDLAAPIAETLARFGRHLASRGDVFRRSAYAGGLILASSLPNVDPILIRSTRELASIVVDRVPVQLVENGKNKGNLLKSSFLALMLRSEAFLQAFPAVDEVLRSPRYLADFRLTQPGLNDGGFNQRILYVGGAPRVEATPDATTRFLNVMQFASNADRTNAVAAALTVMLRNHWPGRKPVIVVTSTKSHGGKDTIVRFASGMTPDVSVSYEEKDWALQRSFTGALRMDQQIGLVNVENVRLSKGAKVIASAFLERFATDPKPFLFSTGTGAPSRRANDIVIAISTNHGTISTDLMNRALPIHLAPVGDIATRVSPIGNPKHEFLPQNRERIDAELRGMIEKWKQAGMPLVNDVRHAFTEWAGVIGGILQVNGFTDFLGNYALRQTLDDPVREALGILAVTQLTAQTGTAGAASGGWLRPGEWAQVALSAGLLRALFAEVDRDTPSGRERSIGKVLKAHVGETFTCATDEERFVFRLEGERRRRDGQEPKQRYRFALLEREALPEDTHAAPAT